jgi:hypothetical protein
LCTEKAHLPDFVRHVVTPPALDEEAGEALGRDLKRDSLRVAAPPRRRERPLVDVAREDLDGSRGFEPLHLLADEHCDRIGLLAGGAARNPDADLVGMRALAQKLGDGAFRQRREGVRLPEEARDRDQELAKEQV